jgi:hypothetical protein
MATLVDFFKAVGVAVALLVLNILIAIVVVFRIRSGVTVLYANTDATTGADLITAWRPVFLSRAAKLGDSNLLLGKRAIQGSNL